MTASALIIPSVFVSTEHELWSLQFATRIYIEVNRIGYYQQPVVRNLWEKNLRYRRFLEPEDMNKDVEAGINGQ